MCLLNVQLLVALKFCFKTCVAMKFVDDDDDELYSINPLAAPEYLIFYLTSPEDINFYI